MLRVQRRHHHSRAEWSEHPSDCGTENNSIGARIRSIHPAGGAIHATISATYSQR
jgi:hypothetical protein